MHVFQYLTLFECLQFTTVNRTSLLQMEPEIQKRRRVQFLCRHEELVRQVDTPQGPKLCCVRIRPVVNLDHIEENSVATGAATAAAVAAIARTKRGDPMAVVVGGCTDQRHPLLQPLGISSHQTEQWFVLPSARERMQGLHRSLPASHPMNDQVRELKLELEKVRREERVKEDLKHDSDSKNKNDADKIADNNATFPELLSRLRDATKAHRLHASLLKRCTIDLDPAPSPLSIYQNYNHQQSTGTNQRELTVTLDQYMGDVMSAYYLTGHSLAGIIEGGPSFDQWVEEHLPSLVRDDDSGQDTKTNCKQLDAPNRWYQMWIFLHSSMLRTTPLTVDQGQRQLGVLPLAGIRFDLNGDAAMQLNRNNINNNDQEVASSLTTAAPETTSIAWFRPPLCYSVGVVDAASLLHNNPSMPDHMQRIIGSLGDPLNVGWHKTTLNQFGPLGPAFRGRDSVTTQIMTPFSLTGLLKSNSQLLLTDPYFGLDTDIDRNVWGAANGGRYLADDDALMKWATDLQRESRRARPLTVLPPLVSISLLDL